jgi:hypothetical protein
MKNNRHVTDFIGGGLPDRGPDRWSDAADELPDRRSDLQPETTSDSRSDGLEEARATCAAGDDVGGLRGVAVGVYGDGAACAGNALDGGEGGADFSGSAEPVLVIASRNIPTAS